MEGKVYEVEFHKDLGVLVRHTTEQAPTCDDGVAVGGKKDIPKSLMLERALDWIRARGLSILAVIKHRGEPSEIFWIITEPIAQAIHPSPCEFALDPDEIKKAHVWVQEHIKTCTFSVVNNRILFTSAEVGVGKVIHVVCSCGQKSDITDYDSF